MNVTLRQLRAFVFVAQMGSFTRAAQAMHVTQSALSLLIRELESQMNTRLVHRTTRSIGLTDVGREFLGSAERILLDLEHALGNVDKLLAKEVGRVVVAAPLVLSGTLLPPILAGFKQRYPGVDLQLKDSLPDQVLPQLRAGTADIGIGTFPKTQDEFEKVLLFKESLVAVYPKADPYRLHAFKGLKWRNLKGLPLLTLPRGSVFRDLAESGFQAASMSLTPAFEATYVGTLLGLVNAGYGVAIVPGYAVALANPQQLTWRRLAQPIIEREVLLLHQPQQKLSPAVKAFIEHLLAHEAVCSKNRKIERS